ncbi:glycine/D-amino acid oxidase-like deaminating enzyme [Haloactinospora alba]|uniref:Glycine/D-amino acid oxidase-like deaminating enzyme n=1 Tax=Haloactinospora alba TaxID=405555 RepID=A0A543NNG4_9ACTN|nr:FAD-binding oxidoreductase [Haloactinospora alba]TQN33365.1 glycine/D-amino acid oxidase-like deaminating enzyme [Haloactinospora alba]
MRERVVIVGGGIHGCATAWYLARQGADVHLLEAATVASGASGGFGKRGVRANRRDLREIPLMRAAYDIWPRLAEELGTPTGYERTGGLNLIERETTGTTGGTVAAEAHANVQRNLGIPTEVLDTGRVRELEPDVSADVRAALYCPMDGIADHTATTRGLAEAARRHGATVREGTAVVDAHRDGDRVTSVVTDSGETVDVGGTLLLLNNTGAVPLVREISGAELPVWRVLPQALLLNPGSEGGSPRHLLGHDHRPLALKRLPDGRVMLSGGWRGRWNAEQGRGELLQDSVEGNLGTAAQVFRHLRDARLETADASRAESCSADGIPVVDTVPGTSNVIVGTGWSGHGFAIAPAVAKLLAQWVCTGSRPDHLLPFSYARF